MVQWIIWTPIVIENLISSWSIFIIDNNDIFVDNGYSNGRVDKWILNGTHHESVMNINSSCTRLFVDIDNRLNQLNYPTYIFVDEDHSVYVSDNRNHRVMKWTKDVKEGIIVAGGHGLGNSLRQLYHSHGIIVDQLGTFYVADENNHRVIRWLKEAQEGTILLGRNGSGKQPNQFFLPMYLFFDRKNNLYVVDYGNTRIQKFDINSNKN
jgi:sugar lactone lactonase YvrE